MDVGKSFTYMFEDKEWISKIAIGGLILLIPIVGWLIVFGYVLRVIRNVYDGTMPVLPEWNEIGDMLVKGFMAFLGVLVWSIPVIILACCMALAAIVFGSAAEGNGSEAAAAMGGLLTTCLSCLIIIVSIAISLFVYAPITNFALTNQINTFWDFNGAWRFIQANPGNYFIAFLLSLVANFIASFGVILCFIGVLFTTFWYMLVMGHLFGQVARSHMTPTDSSMLPPMPPTDEPPSMTQGPMEPSPSI